MCFPHGLELSQYLVSALLVRVRATRLQKLKNEAVKGRFLY